MSAREETRAPALPFATTNYTEDQEGVLRAVLPSRCVYATEEQTCVMFVDHYRERKTGPCFPVAVVGCRVHGGRRYTLYPPGHYPYGRVAYAPYSAAGQVLVDAESGQPQWDATLFEAALDAEQEERWPSEQHWWQRLEVPRRRTQGRRLEVAGRLTGVHPQLAEDVRERIATRLGVATMVLIAGARAWGRWWRTRGSAVAAVLHALGGGTSLMDAWRQPGRSATCGGRRARDEWRAGRRAAPVGCWRPPVVPQPWNSTLAGLPAGARRRTRQWSLRAPAAALRWAHE